MSRNTLTVGVVLGLAGVFSGSCNNNALQDPAAGRGVPNLVSARSLSPHYVEATFAEPVGADAQRPDLYRITGPDETEIPVNEVTAGTDPRVLILTTGLQVEGAQYVLALESINNAAGGTLTNVAAFPGMSGSEPALLTAIPLSNTSVLLTFNKQVDALNAQNILYYKIANPDLGITAAVIGGNAFSVVLTTSSHEETQYRVRVTNVKSQSGYFVNPESNTATFDGIGRSDARAPRLVGAEATSYTTVLLSFSEPLQDLAGDVSSYGVAPTIPPPANLLVYGATPNEFGTQVVLQTQSLVIDKEYTATVSGVEDRNGNVIDPAYRTTTFTFAGDLTEEGEHSGDPRVVGAISIGNTHVDVHYSEPMGDSAADPEHYDITTADTGFLLVTDAVFNSDRTTARLTTSSQALELYTVQAAGVKDLDGNPIAAPSSSLLAIVGLDPTKARFLGTPPGGVDEHVDSDGDGVPDWFETLGWHVVIEDGRTNVERIFVTSNPHNPDSDGDGLTDLEEYGHEFDPQTADTDADGIKDYDEFNVWYSNPTDQDTDNDTLDDALEITFFLTSAILADTDGDQMTDTEELFRRNRSPFIADLPLPQITVDDVSLDLKITSSFMDEQGTTQSISDTTSTTFTQSRTNTLGTSDTTTTQTEAEFGQEIAAEGGSAGWKVSGKATFGQSLAHGFSSTVDRQASETSQKEYQESVTNALEQSERRSITRNIDEAIVQATVNISNQSDLAFTITNLEVSLLQQDRFTGLTFRPIATLRPTGASDLTAQPAFNLAPLEQERGPIIFENTAVFPNRIDALMREPTGLIFQVVNFDVLDEAGRNLVFTSQDVGDRTAGITLDFGDGQVEAYRVATANAFDGNGRPIGITMERALELIGITKATGPGDDRNNTYATVADNRLGAPSNPIVVEALVRMRDVEKSVDGRRFWTAVSSNIDLDPNSDFSTLVLHAHDTILLMFTSDEDRDGLFLREEYLYGSDDTLVDSDGDGLNDFAEVRVGWTVFKVPGLPYKTFSSPARPDSDLDGLEDDLEKTATTDPNRADTDEDALSDASELQDTYAIALFDGDPLPPTTILNVSPYSDWAVTAGPDGACDTGVASGDDTVVADIPVAAKSKLCIASGPNGVINTTLANDDKVVAIAKIDPGPDGKCQTTIATDDDVVESSNANSPAIKGSLGRVCISAGLNNVLDTTASGDDFVRIAHKGLFGTNPLSRDTDLDGVPDGREVLLGINPNRKDAGNVIDTDGDGLFDQEEEAGWAVASYAGAIPSDKNRPDTDFDGIPDVIERAIGSHPNRTNTDTDTLLDYLEFDSDNPIVNAAPLYDVVILDAALQRCDAAPNCTYVAPPASQVIGTHPALADTDGDTRNDDVELNVGWSIDTYPPGDAVTVKSSPKFADHDDDALNDAAELAALTDPEDADTDGDGREDGLETGNLSPLRQDYNLRVTLSSIYVVGDCDAGTFRGLELVGEFKVTKPDGSVVTQFSQPGIGGDCTHEEIACEVHDCCNNDDPSRCEGQDFLSSGVATEFLFRQGESFTLSTSTLYDNDVFDCFGTGFSTLGSYSETVNFTLSLGASLTKDAGSSDDCKVRSTYNYTVDP